MAKKGFASSIGSALEGRSLQIDSINKKEERPISAPVNRIVETEPPRTETLVQSAPKENTPAQELIIEEPKQISAASSVQKEEPEKLVPIGFNLTSEDARFIHRASIRNEMSKEELFGIIFSEMLDYEIDEDDPDYKLFSERFKKEVRYTTRVNEDLYKKMRKTATENYLKINGYINFVIRKYRLNHETV